MVGGVRQQILVKTKCIAVDVAVGIPKSVEQGRERFSRSAPVPNAINLRPAATVHKLKDIPDCS